jgi:hypothetical protein
MSEILLTGLAGSHPLGALAAFGLLRCCEELEGFEGSRLGWRHTSDWFAVLVTKKTGDPEALVKRLAARQGERPSALELKWTDDPKSSRECYLNAAEDARGELARGKRAFADFLGAFTCDLQVNDDNRMTPTAFYMTSGRQEFLKEARSLSERLAAGISIGRRKKSSEEMFHEALFGHWTYEDPQHSLGWDPSTERLHALRARSPTKEASLGVTAAIWLAFEALPLFPCLFSRGRMATTGFHTYGSSRKGRTTYLTWPVWTASVTIDTVRSLLSFPGLAEESLPVRELRGRGISQVFRSERYKVKSQGSYYILRNAVPCM